MWNANFIPWCVDLITLSASALPVIPSEDHTGCCRPLAWWYLCDIFYHLVGLVPYIMSLSVFLLVFCLLVCLFWFGLVGWFVVVVVEGGAGFKTTGRCFSYSCAIDMNWEWPCTFQKPVLAIHEHWTFSVGSPWVNIYHFTVFPPRMLLLRLRIYSFMSLRLGTYSFMSHAIIWGQRR